MRSLFADLASLDLIEPSKKKHPVADANDYWSLTPAGLDILKIDRAQKLELVAVKLATKKP